MPQGPAVDGPWERAVVAGECAMVADLSDMM